MFFLLVSVVIRKDILQTRYKTPENPYPLALQYGLERVHGFLCQQGQWQLGRTTNPAVHLVVEKRGKNEDDDLELEFRRICDGGNFKRDNFPFEIVFAHKQSNSSGLQLADLVARPIGMSVIRPEQPNRAFELLKPKLVQIQGNSHGWDLKVLP